MRLSGQTIRNLREIINEKSQYRSGPQLVDFFNTLGFHDCYGQGFPSRWVYTEENLKKINGTSDIDECIKTVFAPNNFIDKPELLLQLLEEFNKEKRRKLEEEEAVRKSRFLEEIRKEEEKIQKMEEELREAKERLEEKERRENSFYYAAESFLFPKTAVAEEGEREQGGKKEKTKKRVRLPRGEKNRP